MIPKLKKKQNGETYYNFRTIQILIPLIAAIPTAALAILIHWSIALFTAIWVIIGIIQIQKNYINKGVKYAPKDF